jgi:hypothetical protein
MPSDFRLTCSLPEIQGAGSMRGLVRRYSQSDENRATSLVLQGWLALSSGQTPLQGKDAGDRGETGRVMTGA